MTQRPSKKWSATEAMMLVVMLSCAAAGGGSVALGAPAGHQLQSPAGPRAADRQALSVTPVIGPSHLRRLGLTMGHSSMGWTGQLGVGPDASQRPSGDVTTIGDPTRSMTLSGADLYRLDCRACHKADGTGAPPEINTLIDPVRGTSRVLWERRMKELGRTIDPAFASQVVSGARADLLNRLVHGGQKMPPFDYLQDAEVQALVAYLDLLAGVPGAAQRQRTVVEPATRVGEQLVKSTCHICHDATGSWPTPDALLNGSVPPLAGLPMQHTLFEVIEKVRQGATVIMGSAQMLDRGRMPVFDYLTNDEAAAAYLYLAVYRPR